MRNPFRRSFLVASAAVLALPAYAQAPWPSKPIKLVVPYAPGGSTDVVGRVIAEYLGQRLGQNIVVENRPGKGASIGTSQVAKAAPDGYTLLVSNISSFAIAPPLYGDLDYDPVNDFTHITLASFNPSVLVVNPSFPAKNMKELVDLMTKDPGKYSVGSPGAGTTLWAKRSWSPSSVTGRSSTRVRSSTSVAGWRVGNSCGARPTSRWRSGASTCDLPRCVATARAGSCPSCTGTIRESCGSKAALRWIGTMRWTASTCGCRRRTWPRCVAAI